MASSRHCSTSAGTGTRARSERLSERNVDAGELRGDLRIGAAEAVGQLLAELRPVGVAHDHRAPWRRPAEVVAVERVEQPVDVLGREAADVVLVVDVARRGPDEHERCEQLRPLDGGEHADHRADGVPDEDHVPEPELVADLEHVLGVAVERGVALRVVGGQVGAARADVVEEDDPMIVREGGRDEPPHVLVAPEPVREEHRLPRHAPAHVDVVAGDGGDRTIIGGAGSNGGTPGRGGAGGPVAPRETAIGPGRSRCGDEGDAAPVGRGRQPAALLPPAAYGADAGQAEREARWRRQAQGGRESGLERAAACPHELRGLALIRPRVRPRAMARSRPGVRALVDERAQRLAVPARRDPEPGVDLSDTGEEPAPRLRRDEPGIAMLTAQRQRDAVRQRNTLPRTRAREARDALRRLLRSHVIPGLVDPRRPLGPRTPDRNSRLGEREVTLSIGSSPSMPRLWRSPDERRWNEHTRPSRSDGRGSRGPDDFRTQWIHSVTGDARMGATRGPTGVLRLRCSRPWSSDERQGRGRALGLQGSLGGRLRMSRECAVRSPCRPGELAPGARSRRLSSAREMRANGRNTRPNWRLHRHRSRPWATDESG